MKENGLFRLTLSTFLRVFAFVFGVCAAIIALVALFSSSAQNTEGKTVFRIAPDEHGKTISLPSHAPIFFQIDIEGLIGMPKLRSRDIEALLRGIETYGKDRTKGILLYINTPGGTATDSSSIYRALIDFKAKHQIPIYAYVEGLCASGGMHIGAAADQIFTSPTAIIGSIGVRLGPTFNFSLLMEKLGVESRTFTKGKDKDLLNPWRPWKKGEGESLERITDGLYRQFVDIMTISRPKLKKSKLIKEYGANVFLAKDAQEKGYIDAADSSRAATLKAMRERSGIEDKTPYQVVRCSHRNSNFFPLAEEIFPKMLERISPSLALPHSSFLYLYEPQA